MQTSTITLFLPAINYIKLNLLRYCLDLTVGRAATRSSLAWGSKLGPVDLNTLLLTVRRRCDIFSKGVVLPGCNNKEMDPANLLHALA